VCSPVGGAEPSERTVRVRLLTHGGKQKKKEKGAPCGLHGAPITLQTDTPQQDYDALGNGVTLDPAKNAGHLTGESR